MKNVARSGFSAAKILIVCAFLLVHGGIGIANSQEHTRGDDEAAYTRAVEYCRSNVERPIALSVDKRVLCLDGWVASGQDIEVAKELREESFFVVRSFGGDVATAIALGNVLRDRQATVVVYDYCLSACSGYLFISSKMTIVLKGTLVAWHHINSGVPDCPSLSGFTDGGPKRLEHAPCSDIPSRYLVLYHQVKALHDKYYSERTIDPRFEFPPESSFVRKILQGMFEGTGTMPDVSWTWNPRYYRNTLKAKIVYEAYPESQEEVDAIVSRLHIRRVIYDP